ncbi:TetR family transcriptional regulator [Salinarchaeum sp. Harcht-Bsk1]|uniref:TetR/AcrR family transcriptional regulator n=1 Tax=Salinarchaeum sp. Harcht-Bsk1 TaxID=1333523 RepID=UPI0003424124|nr:TetR/AcrR family transcriptional regulator [Salinarchaeum sp. Harcht-Bsk1]AGN01456.1 TetR family transcriptional regulator [Salinarchaeum sp. Harcht-Bsk1]
MSDDRSTREELLDAAYEVLVSPEYEGFTTAAVAEAAGRNQSLVHYYFDTKRDLVLALFDYLHEIADEHLAAAADAEDPADRLEALLTYLVWADPDATDGEDTLEDAIAFKRGLLWLEAQALTDEDLRAAMDADRRYFWDAVESTIREGIERGRFRASIDPEATAALLVAAVGGAQTWAAIYGEEARDQLVVEAMETLIQEWLVA